MFEPVTTIVGPAAPLPLANIDTDVIIRIDRLTIGDPADLGHWAFEALRYLPDGDENPAFPLNTPAWRGAPILITEANFGCGSSREGAVTALLGLGIRCVIAESFGDIFYGNCFQSGLLPIRLDKATIDRLLAQATAAQRPFGIDLGARVIQTPGGETIPFVIDEHRREAMMAGVDDIELTLRDQDMIQRWQRDDRMRRPWAWAVQPQTGLSSERT